MFITIIIYSSLNEQKYGCSLEANDYNVYQFAI